MAELGIITMLANTPKKAAFTLEQMIEIYEASGRKTDTAALRDTARRLFPDILENGQPPITAREGCARAFRVGEEYVRPAFTLVTNYALMVGILPDGTPMEY